MILHDRVNKKTLLCTLVTDHRHELTFYVYCCRIGLAVIGRLSSKRIGIDVFINFYLRKDFD